MKAARTTEEPAAETPLQIYTYVCLTALVVLFLALLRRGFGGWSFVPALVGLLGVGLGWRMAPILTLTMLTFVLYLHQPAGINQPTLGRDFSLAYLTGSGPDEEYRPNWVQECQK